MTSRVLAIARRDFRATVFTKAFLMAVLGVPVLIVALAGASVLMIGAQRERPLQGTLVVVAEAPLVAAVSAEVAPARLAAERGDTLKRARDVGGELLVRTAEALPEVDPGAISILVEPHAPHGAPTVDAALLARVVSGEVLGAVAIPRSTLEHGARFSLVVNEDVSADHLTFLEQRVARAVVRARANAEAVDVDHLRKMLETPRSETQRALRSGTLEPASSGRRILRRSVVPAVLMILLWAGAFAAGQQLLFSTIEEKSNKLVEVLLSAVSPLQLMAGKIIGYGLVGLLILLVYGSAGILSLAALARMDLISGTQLAWSAVFFAMAYCMVAPIMAAIGSAVNSVHEANALLMPVMVLLMVPMGLWMPISQDPGGTVAVVFSFIPPVMPFVLTLRLATDTGVPTWQLFAALAWGTVAVFALVWFAARVFRVGILMEGKPPSLAELVRWARVA